MYVKARAATQVVFPEGATVKDLCQALQTVSPSARLYIEGCDCVARCIGVTVSSESNSVILRRGGANG